MLILLPPSEKKVQSQSGPALDLDSLSFSKELRKARTALLREHRSILQQSTDAAINVYAGVLFQALDWKTLDTKSQAFGKDRVLISSALFGLLWPLDSIPAYKLKMQPSIWKLPVSKALIPYEENLVIDCRSSSYAATWTPPKANTVLIKVFEERNGVKQVITHMAKKTRGEVVRTLLLENQDLRDPREILEIFRKEYKCELVEPTASKSWQLEIIAN